ncbi:MAG: hypothetical protein Q9161_008553 [Pseudevernia consocians]
MPVNVLFISYILLAAVALATIAKLAHFQVTKLHQPTDLLSEPAQNTIPHANATTATSPAKHEEAAQSPFAFVGFLAGNWQHEEFDDDNEDVYFYSMRVLGYQLMHNPEIRSNTSIPFVVLTTKGVSERKKARLRKDGAVVIVVDDVPLPEWFSIGNPLWLDVMTKLRVFQQTQYQKILLLDADVLPVRRLDGVFLDPATDTVAPLHDKKREGDQIPLPATYMFAGMTNGGGREHDSETKEKYYASMAKYNELDQVNAGFLLAAPSRGIYDYYFSVLHEEGRFDPAQPEQNLLIEAHRIDGPMPWKRIRYDWVINSPNFGDYEHGVHAVHEKLWRGEHRVEEYGMKDLAALWDKARGEMEGYYRALDDPSPTTQRVRAESG